MDVYVLSGMDESSSWPSFTQYVPNFAIRASWAYLQHSDGSIHLDNVGAAITAVANAGFSGKVSLRVVAGTNSPTWGTWATVSDGSGGSIPVPWDANYVSAYETFLTDLASAISTAGYTFDHISFVPFSGDNGELRIQGSISDWTNNAGYSITTYFNEFKNLTTKVHNAFSGLVNYISWTDSPMTGETMANNHTLFTDMIDWWQISPAGALTGVGDMQNGGSGSGIQDFSSYTVNGVAWQAVSALGNTGVNNFLDLCSAASATFAEIYTGDISYVTKNR